MNDAKPTEPTTTATPEPAKRSLGLNVIRTNEKVDELRRAFNADGTRGKYEWITYSQLGQVRAACSCCSALVVVCLTRICLRSA